MTEDERKDRESRKLSVGGGIALGGFWIGLYIWLAASEIAGKL